MSWSARGMVGGLVAATLILTGCSTPPSAAAIVGDQQISHTSVRQAASALVAASGAEADVALRQAAYDLLMGEASDQILARHDLMVTDAERAELLATSETANAIANTPDGAEWGRSVAQTYLAIERLGSDAYASDIADLGIVVNPRYGSWDPAQVTVVDSALSAPFDPLAVNR